jgi:hypothetical protein
VRLLVAHLVGDDDEIELAVELELCQEVAKTRVPVGKDAEPQAFRAQEAKRLESPGDECPCVRAQEMIVELIEKRAEGFCRNRSSEGVSNDSEPLVAKNLIRGPEASGVAAPQAMGPGFAKARWMAAGSSSKP